MSPDELRDQVKRRAVAPVYVLVGTDEREKSALAALFADVVEPDLQAFNVERYYGGETSVGALLESVRTLPMMSDRRIVVVLQAERLLMPRRRGTDAADEAGGEDLEPLVAYVGAPARETTLVFVLAPPEADADARKRARAAALERQRANHQGPRQACDGRDLRRLRRLRRGGALAARSREGGRPDRRAARVERLVDLSGGDVGKFKGDAERVLLYAAGQGAVTLEHVDDVAEEPGSSDDWALVRALERGDAATALRELRSRLEQGDVPFMILGQLAWAVRTPPPRGRYPAHKLPAAVDALFRTDLALKSSGDPRLLLERLVIELCG
jgi:DNA polymerase III delta subunit